MDQLNVSLKTLRDELSGNLQPSKFKKILTKAGVKTTKDECEDVLGRVVEGFKRKLDEEYEKIITETDVDAKLEELTTLTEESEEMNKELNVKHGYRPNGDPGQDMMGHLMMVHENYYEALKEIKETALTDLQEARAELEQKMAILKNLSKELNNVVRQ